MITALDIVIIILFLYFILRGYNKGFIKQTSTIIGLVFALFIAINQYQNFQGFLVPYLDVSPGMLQFITFAILFILVNLVIHILGMVIKNIFNLLFLEPLDHIVGAVLGLLKGGILAYLLVLFLAQIPYSNVVQMIDHSFFAKNFLEMTPFIQQNLQEIFRP